MLPTAFVAGPVKGGTSSIYECLSATFHPKAHVRREYQRLGG